MEEEATMKKQISKKGKRNRFIAFCLLLLLIGFSSSRAWDHLKAKETAQSTVTPSTKLPQSETKKVIASNAKILLDVPLIDQMEEPSLYNGCEITGLAMMLNYAGVAVTKNELAEKIRVVDYQDEKGIYGDPNDGFVGDIYGNSTGYSVYHKPIVSLAKEFISKDLKVVDLTNQDFETILLQLLEDRPVWVITTVPMKATADMEKWKTANGTIKISWNVHSVLMTGFDQNSIYINDPYGDKNKKVDRDDFEEAWLQMGSQAVVIQTSV